MITESTFLYYYLLATPKHRMDAATLYTGLTSGLEVYNFEVNVLLSSRIFSLMSQLVVFLRCTI